MTEGGETVLVTGAAGFIGSHLCDRLLAGGHRVLGLDDLSTGRIANLGEARSYGKQFRFDHADIRDPAIYSLFAKEAPGVLMHLAARSGVRQSVADPPRDAEVNVLGTINLLEAAARHGTRKVVLASSGASIYGDPRRVPVKESSAASAHPLSPFGITKKVSEHYLRYYQRFRGLDFTALAIGTVYGPRQDPEGEAGVVAAFASGMIAGETPTIHGDGNQTRDYVYVEDAVQAFSLAVDRGSGRLINIGTGLETSVNHLYRLVAGLIGFEGEPAYGPLPTGEPRRVALDPSLAESELGWKPWTQLEDGLAKTVEALKS